VLLRKRFVHRQRQAVLDFADFSSGLEKALRNERRTENPPEIDSDPI